MLTLISTWNFVLRCQKHSGNRYSKWSGERNVPAWKDHCSGYDRLLWNRCHCANAVCNSVGGFPLIPGTTIGLAMVTVVGQCVGAQRYEEAKKYIVRLTGLAYIFMLILNILIAVFCGPIVGFFNLSAEATSTAEQSCSGTACSVLVLWPTAFTMPNGLRAANDVKFTMTVSVLSMWICRICMSYVFGTMLGMGVLGTWFAMFP